MAVASRPSCPKHARGVTLNVSPYMTTDIFLHTALVRTPNDTFYFIYVTGYEKRVNFVRFLNFHFKTLISLEP